MNNEQELAAALRALAEMDSGEQAPPKVEIRLRRAFRERRARRRLKRAAVWTVAAAAVIVAGIAILHPRQQTATVMPREESVTEFFPLMEPVPPLGRGELLRVSLPAAAMRTVGLPVREDRLSERVEADVLVSEDGLAEAIRFVNVSDHP